MSKNDLESDFNKYYTRHCLNWAWNSKREICLTLKQIKELMNIAYKRGKEEAKEK